MSNLPLTVIVPGDGSPRFSRTLQAALDGAGIAWYLNSVQFEPDTGYVHLEWVFQAAG